MNLVEFAEQTVVFAKDQPEYLPLPAHRFADDPQGRIACCWRMSWRERLKVLWTGLVWHEVLTFGCPLQPQRLSTEKPDMSADTAMVEADG
ncbi:MAG: hypothetical protein KDE23_22795 [Caldilinea sp.]|nr:hypothetical protein [Caldilinea sp.]